VSLNRYIAKQLSNPAGFGGKLIFSIMNRQVRPLYKETIRLLTPSNTDSILDIGCGNGYALKMFASQYAGTFTGIDISTSIIKDAERRCRKLVRGRKLSLSCQDASAMLFADGSFNKAYTINTVYFWENLDNTMSEIWRTLKPNGLFINTLFSNETLSRLPHTKFEYKRWTLEELTSAGSNLGFVVNIIPIMSDTAYCILYHKTN